MEEERNLQHPAERGECCDKGGDVGSGGSIKCHLGYWCRDISYIHGGCDKGCTIGICVEYGAVAGTNCLSEGCNYNCLSGWCKSDYTCE